jgi:hypothetical protein
MVCTYVINASLKLQLFRFFSFIIFNCSDQKKTEVAGTGGGPPPASFTPAEELALEINKGRPVLEGIEGGTSSKMISRSIRSEYIKGVCVFYYHYSFLTN